MMQSKDRIFLRAVFVQRSRVSYNGLSVSLKANRLTTTVRQVCMAMRLSYLHDILSSHCKNFS